MLTDTKFQCRYLETVVVSTRYSVDTRVSVDATLYIVWARRKAPQGPLPVTAHCHYHDLGYRGGMLHGSRSESEDQMSKMVKS